MLTKPQVDLMRHRNTMLLYVAEVTQTDFVVADADTDAGTRIFGPAYAD